MSAASNGISDMARPRMRTVFGIRWGWEMEPFLPSPKAPNAFFVFSPFFLFRFFPFSFFPFFFGSSVRTPGWAKLHHLCGLGWRWTCLQPCRSQSLFWVDSSLGSGLSTPRHAVGGQKSVRTIWNPWATIRVVGRGRLFFWFLRWCRISSIHSTLFIGQPDFPRVNASLWSQRPFQEPRIFESQVKVPTTHLRDRPTWVFDSPSL